ncbi:MAG: hypothetical protein ABIF19_03415 [Planctomycetota bacterium]
MPANRLNEEAFDEMLGRALRSFSEPVPGNFTEKTLMRLRESDQHRILARVVLQERLALAGCIVLAAALCTSVVLFPDVILEAFEVFTGRVTMRGRLFVETVPQAIETVCGQWQLYVVLTGVLGFAIYSLAGLLLGEKVQDGLRV